MRWLLYLYPTGFRREYGRDIAAEYAARRTAARGAAVLLLWVDVLLDTIGNAALVHWDLLRQDLRQGARNLGRSPVFAIAAVLVIAIGIGANTAAFSIADYVFFRPLPFAHANRIVTIWQRVDGYDEMQPSAPNYRDWRRMAQSFDGMAAYHSGSVSLLGGQTPRQLPAIAVHGPLFDILGAHPLIGYLPSRSEMERSAPVAVLGYSLWRDDFGGDPAVVGRTVTIDGRPYTVTGVMPRTFAFPDRSVRLWTSMLATEANDTDRGNNWFYVVARLRSGRTLDQARRDMDRVGLELQRIHPDSTNLGTTVLSLRATYASQAAAGDQRGTLLMALCGAAICVLLITCANLVNLLLVRATGRRRELAVRAALGAGRERLVRQLLTESLLLAGVGGALGVGLAFAAMPLLDQLVPDTLPLAQAPSIDVRVLAVAALLTLCTGIGVGVLPAIRAGGASAFEALREGARTGGGQRHRLRATLVMIEVMVSVVLLVGAGLLLRAMWRVRGVDPGFDPQHVTTLRTELPPYRYWRTAARTAFYQGVLGRVRALPGVTGAGYISFLPMQWGGGIWVVDVPPDTGFRHASLRFITPGYLGAMRIPVVRGRDVNDGDTPAAPDAAVVSQSFAQRFWPGRNPVGQHFTFAFADRTVVGVVGDVRVRGPERESEPQVYLPYQQVPDSALTFYAPKDLVIRTAHPVVGLVAAVRRIVREVDPLEPVANVQSLSAVVAAQTLSRAVQARVLALFAVIAMLLAGIGLHGVLAFAVTQRRQELAIRLALGAQGGRIVWLVLRQGAVLALIGIVPGAVAGYAVGRMMSAALVGVAPDDPLTFAVAIGLCVLMVALGTALPAGRAVRTPPASVMRTE